MGSLYDVVAALQVMGLELKALGDEAVKTTEKVKAARETTAGIADDPTSTVERIETTSLGDAGNPENQMIRLFQAVEAAKRGR